MTDRFVTLATAGMETQTAYRLLCGAVVPRPIAWITSIDENGLVNAAPFSSFNYVAHSPPMLAVNIGRRPAGPKDTARNIERSREFVVNVATTANMEQMHQTSADFAPDESEPHALDLALIPSVHVEPPRIAISPVQMECRLQHVLHLGQLNTLYIGEVLAFHLSTEVFDGRSIDSARLQPVARLGGPWYTTLGTLFERPVLATPPGPRKD